MLETRKVRIIRDCPASVDIDALLSRPLLAHLATTSALGPRESPVWFLWEDGKLWIIGDRRKDTFPGRIAADPRCAIGIVDFEPQRGLVQHVGFRGRASVEPFEPDRAKRLLRRYLGEQEADWDPRFTDT